MKFHKGLLHYFYQTQGTAKFEEQNIWPYIKPFDNNIPIEKATSIHKFGQK